MAWMLQCCADYSSVCGGGGGPAPTPSGSCSGACGGQAAGGCFCDAGCTSFNDVRVRIGFVFDYSSNVVSFVCLCVQCCSDYAQVCGGGGTPAPSGSCAGNCGGSGGSCFCDSLCTSFNDVSGRERKVLIESSLFPLSGLDAAVLRRLLLGLRRRRRTNSHPDSLRILLRVVRRPGGGRVLL